MNAESLISKLRREGIRLWFEDGKLRYKAPEGKMTPELLNEVKSRKDGLIAILLESMESESCQLPVKKAVNNVRIPLHFAQERLLFIDRYEGGKNPGYNIPMAFRLKGQLNTESLEKAINYISQRHDILRTTFHADQNGTWQEIKTWEKLTINAISLKEEELEKTLREEANRTFDLRSGPLMRINLYYTGNDECVLMIIMHHIISDGWSKGILLKELNECYSAFEMKKEPDLQPMKIQYSDFSFFQREQLRLDSMKKKTDYWKKKLKNFTDLDFPADFVRPANKTYRGKRHCFSIDSTMTESLKRISERKGASLFMTLTAVFNILLCRYCNKDDIITGTPIAGRDREEFRDLIGFFVNTVVIRCILEGNPTFIEFLGQVKETILEAYMNQDVPFEQIVEALSIERDPGRTPIFQVLCTMTGPQDGISINFPGLTASEIEVPFEVSKFDLSFAFSENTNIIQCEIEYNTDLFGENRIKAMEGHFKMLLAGISDNPDLPVQDYSILTEGEKKTILYDWNFVEKPFTEKSTIKREFEKVAMKFPDHIALICNDKNLTYKELNMKSNKLAHTIREQFRKHYNQEMKSDELIGICVDRDINMIVGIMGILKAGGAYVPLDPRYPENRLKFMAEDAGCKIILTEQTFLEQLLFMTKGDFIIISLDKGWNIIEKSHEDNPESINHPDDLAYVIYTSGSTGKPKGVLIPHSNVIRLFKAADNYFEFSEKDVWSCFHSYAFDFSVWEIWGALLYGGCIVIVPYYISRDPEQFHTLVNKEKITVMSQTPSAFYNFMDADLRSNVKNDSLRYIVYGGEALDIQKLKPWWEKYSHDAPYLINMYGITETTVHTTFKSLSPSDTKRKHVYSPIGKRLYDMTIYVLDKNRNPVPVSVPGELFVGGAGVSRGYFHRPELTGERFINNPFVTEREKSLKFNETLYKSGDLARWMPDGELEYIGRNDFQVKIRGFRIELGEIESVLGKHKAVSQCIILVKEYAGQQHLTAYYSVKKGTNPPETHELRAHLGKELADYMIPSFFIELSSLPLTDQGKIDRKALPSPDDRQISLKTEYIPPETTGEKALAEIWRNILNAEKIGVNDNFFSIGGNSLSSIQMIYMAKDRGIYLSPKDIFMHPTIKELSKLADIERILEHRASEHEYEPVVSFNIEGKNPPLFFIHPGQGGAEVYLGMSKLLDTEQPFHAIESYNLYGEKPLLQSIEAIASRYLQYIRVIQPGGPYFLGGWCLGGLISFEIAQQLKSAGLKTEMIYMIDSFAFGDYERELINNFKDRKILEGFLKADPLYSKFTSDYKERVIDASIQEYTDLSVYIHRYYEGEAILFKALQTQPITENIDKSILEINNRLDASMNPKMDNGWSEHISKLTIIEMEANHHSLMEGLNIKKIADIIQDDIITRSAEYQVR